MPRAGRAAREGFAAREAGILAQGHEAERAQAGELEQAIAEAQDDVVISGERNLLRTGSGQAAVRRELVDQLRQDLRQLPGCLARVQAELANRGLSLLRTRERDPGHKFGKADLALVVCF